MAHLPGTPRRKERDRGNDRRAFKAGHPRGAAQPAVPGPRAWHCGPRQISYAHLANILYAADWLRNKCTLTPPAPGARPPFASEYRKRTFRKAGSPFVTAMPVGLVQAAEDVHRNRCDHLYEWRFEHPSDERLLYDLKFCNLACIS